MIILKAKFESISELITKTNLIFSTTEEIPKIAELQLLGSEGYLVFNPDEYRTQVLAIIKNKRIGVNEEEMTHSQKMRNVLYLVWMENGSGEFEAFYASEMTKIIEHYKKKL